MRKDEPVIRAMNVSGVAELLCNLIEAFARNETRVAVEEAGAPVAALVSAKDLDQL
jgi:hypothetical protein